MADQVNPIGGLAAGSSFQVATAHIPRSAPETTVAANTNNVPAQRAGNQTVPVSSQRVEAAVMHLNNHLQQIPSELKLSLDKATGRTVYKVVDTSTGSVVMQIPSEEVLAMAHQLQAATKGNTGVLGALVDKEG